MRKRWLGVTLVAIALVAAAAWLFPALLYVPLGFLRSEAFFAGKPTSYWLRNFKHESYLGEAAPTGDTGETLRKGGAQSVPVLAQLAEDPDPDIRYEALIALSLMGPEAKDATPVLATAISREDNSARFLAASEALLRANPAAAVEALSAVLRDKKNLGGRAWALAALYNHAPLGRETLPTVNEILRDPEEDPRLRIEAARVCWRFEQPTGPLVEALCQVAASTKGSAGAQAIEVIGEMGPGAKEAVPTLVKLLENPQLAASGRIFGPPSRLGVIRNLGRIGSEARASVPALLATLKNNNRQLHTETVRALAHIGPTTKDAVPALNEALHDSDPEVRSRAADALKRIESEATPAKAKG
jgi:HEAT repeat protein